MRDLVTRGGTDAASAPDPGSSGFLAARSPHVRRSVGAVGGARLSRPSHALRSGGGRRDARAESWAGEALEGVSAQPDREANRLADRTSRDLSPTRAASGAAFRRDTAISRQGSSHDVVGRRLVPRGGRRWQRRRFVRDCAPRRRPLQICCRPSSTAEHRRFRGTVGLRQCGVRRRSTTADHRGSRVSKRGPRMGDGNLHTARGRRDRARCRSCLLLLWVDA